MGLFHLRELPDFFGEILLIKNIMQTPNITIPNTAELIAIITVSCMLSPGEFCDVVVSVLASCLLVESSVCSK